MSIGRRSLYRQIAEGRIKTAKIGRRTVIPSGAIRDFLAAAIEAASKPTKAAA
jgi:Helix-turn-helix domain